MRNHPKWYIKHMIYNLVKFEKYLHFQVIIKLPYSNGLHICKLQYLKACRLFTQLALVFKVNIDKLNAEILNDWINTNYVTKIRNLLPYTLSRNLHYFHVHWCYVHLLQKWWSKG